MPRWSLALVRIVEALNYRVGRFAMYLLFVLMAILLWSSLTTTGSKLGLGIRPSNWTLEMAQFMMVAYYILGGPYSMQMGAHVRMDLLYARWSPRRRAGWDAVTVLFLIFYLGVMIWGAVDTTIYSLGLRWVPVEAPWLPFEIHRPATGFMERAPTAWRPYLWPIKAIMVLGFVLMLLQALACLIRDIAEVRGVPIPPGAAAR